ncbi:hypothetical protein DFH06DRAFT_1172088 [Mycena polygramma]|nr:hypothetical protein DFH06DRAFT_1172088 [Mycena polygramma]
MANSCSALTSLDLVSLSGSLLRASFRRQRSIVPTRLRRVPIQHSKYSSEASPKLHFPRDLLNDVVGEIALPSGNCSLKFARLPTSPGPNEPSTACLLWATTKAALLAAHFEPSLTPAASRPDMYTIGPSTVAGTGVFAQDDIQCGETVIVERPFLKAVANGPDNVPDSGALVPLVSATLDEFVVQRMSKHEQIHMLRLFSSDDSTYQIMSQNSIPIFDPLPGSYEGPHSALCRDVSRINHSCSPNVELAWAADSFTVSICANRHISKGEELFCGYTNLLLPRSERMEHLDEQYSFTCSCPSCSLPDEESRKSDAIRRSLMDDMMNIPENFSTDDSGETVDGQFVSWLSDPALSDDYITAYSEGIIEMMDKDGAGILAHRIMHLGRLMRAYIILGDEEKARHWASKTKETHFSEEDTMRYASDILAGRGPEDKEWAIRNKVVA